MDSYDRRILLALQSQGRMQNKDLADRIGLSAAPCLRRTRVLEEAGVIESYAAVVSPEKVGFSLVVFAAVSLINQGRDSTQAFEKAVQSYTNVIECNLMTGSFDYLLKIVAHDISDYEGFLMDKLTKLSCIDKVESFVAMRTVKRSAIIPV